MDILTHLLRVNILLAAWYTSKGEILMVLTEAEKETFLQTIAELIDNGIIDEDVMRGIYVSLMGECIHRLNGEIKEG